MLFWNELRHLNLDVSMAPWRKDNIFGIFKVQYANLGRTKYGVYTNIETQASLQQMANYHKAQTININIYIYIYIYKKRTTFITFIFMFFKKKIEINIYNNNYRKNVLHVRKTNKSPRQFYQKKKNSPIYVTRMLSCMHGIQNTFLHRTRVLHDILSYFMELVFLNIFQTIAKH